MSEETGSPISLGIITVTFPLIGVAYKLFPSEYMTREKSVSYLKTAK